MKKTPPEIEKEVVSLYTQDRLTLKQVAKTIELKYGTKINPVTCQNILIRNNVERRTHGGINPLRVEEVKDLYFNQNMTLVEAAEKLNVCPNTIKNTLLKAGIYEPTKYRNLELKHDYFERIESEEQAYLLGFLIADGNVYQKNQTYAVRLSVHTKDIYILELLKKELHSDNQITQASRRPHSSFAICSEHLGKDLMSHGVIPRKTTYETFPEINTNLHRHLIRGLFDGDGWVSTFTRTGKKNKSIGLGFCGTEQLLTGIAESLTKHCGVISNKIVKKENLCYLLWGDKSDVYSIYQYLYKDATCFLNRKKIKLDEFYGVVNTREHREGLYRKSL